MPDAVSMHPHGGPYTLDVLREKHPELTDADIDLRKRCVHDPLFLGAEILSFGRQQHLRDPSPAQKRVTQALLDCVNLLFLSPRGHWKTTLVDEIGTVSHFIRWPADRVLFLQASVENAKQLAGLVRNHLIFTTPLRGIFPEYAMRTSDQAGQILSFNIPCRPYHTREKSLEIGTPEMSLAGRHYDVIRASDLMNEQTTPPPCGNATPEEMLKIINWYASADALLDSKLSSPRAHKTIDGVFYCDYDLYSEIIRLDKHNRWVRIVEGIDVWEEEGKRRFKPVWDKITEEMLREKYESPTMTPAFWAANYAMNPLYDSGTMRFTESMIHYYEEVPDGLEVGITVDPAWTAKKKGNAAKSDRSAIVVSGVAPRGGFYVLHAEAGRWSPDELVERVGALCAFWNPPWGVGFEQDDKGLKSMFFNMMLRTGMYVPYRTLKPDGKDKEHRASHLHQHAQHWGIFVKDEHRELVDELLRFPVGRHDDYVDALAYRAFNLGFNRIRDLVIKPKGRPDNPRNLMTGQDVLDILARRSSKTGMTPWDRVLIGRN